MFDFSSDRPEGAGNTAAGDVSADHSDVDSKAKTSKHKPTPAERLAEAEEKKVSHPFPLSVCRSYFLIHYYV